MDILLRDLNPEDIEWIKKKTQNATSQNKFIKSLISEARIKEKLQLVRNSEKKNSYQDSNTPFSFIDLFAGIGGFRSALTFLGGKCVFTNEWNKYAITTYKNWYGDEESTNDDDIRNFNHSLIPNHDVLCAGFPCQPFSLAGVSKKNSLGRKHGFEDADQGNLFDCIMSIVDVKRPPILFLENVKNLKSHDKGNTWKHIHNEISSRGYEIFSKVIDASNWVPQHRERIFIVCFDKSIFCKDRKVNFQFPEFPTTREYSLSSFLEKNPDKKYMLSDKLWNYLKNYAAKHKQKGNGFGFGLNTPNNVARTMSARYYKDGSEILIKQKGWKNPRRLTPLEAKYLMGFKDTYARVFGHKNGFPQVVSDTQAYKQFGNSVIPPVVEDVALKIIEVMASRILDERSKGFLGQYK